MASSGLFGILTVLEAIHCRFIVVGGVAAVLNGAPIQTFNVDLVYERSSENIQVLVKELEQLDAVFRLQPERRLRPSLSHLTAGGHLNLLTRSGPLKVLGTIGTSLAYEDLLAQSFEVTLREGVIVKVLDLETLVLLKEALSGETDLAVLPVLRRTLSESRKTNAD